MERNHTARRISVIRKVGWLSVASMLALAMLAPAAAPALAAGQSVTICHGTKSNSNPYVTESPSVQANGATEGQLTGGHSNETGPLWFDGTQADWGDIIPPYYYPATNYFFLGLNWTVAGQAIFNNGCATPTTTTTTTTGTSTTTSSSTTGTSTTTSSTTSTSTTSTTTGSTTTSTSTTTSSTTTPSQSVLAETDVPTVSLPPTDGFSGSSAPSSESWRMLLIVAAALLASVMVMAPTRAASRRR